MSGKGSVQREANGTWMFIVDTPAVNGKRKQHKRRGFPTKKAAQDALSEVVTTVNKGAFIAQSTMTVAHYLRERWLPTRRRDLRETTVYGYEKAVARIVPLIGNLRLTQLDTAGLEAFYAQLHDSGGKHGTPLAPKTVANVAGVLSTALSDAVRWRLLNHNPASSARIPRRDHREMTAWTAEDAQQFLAHVRKDRLHPIWRLVLATGIRRGELAGLRWKDVNLNDATLTVEHTRVVAAKVVDGQPKTRAGHRVITLDQDTVTILASWKRQLAAERLAAGPAWDDLGYVLVNEFGKPPHPETITQWWSQAVRRAGVPEIRLHDARHTAASLMLRDRVPVKVVSQRLGHADVAVTMRTYQHVTAQDDQAAAAALGRALRKPS